MSEETKTHRRRTRHGFWFGLVAGAVGGAVLASALAMATPVLAARAFSQGHGGRGSADPEARLERARFAAAFVLDRLDATESQKSDADRIVTDALAALGPLGEQHRAHRGALHAVLARPVVDGEEIERLRRLEMELAEAASVELASALTALANTLTPEQRAELLEMGERFHH